MTRSRAEDGASGAPATTADSRLGGHFRGELEPAMPDLRAFPPGFRWGVATSAYQIEGSVDADGRGASIWDTFAETPGTIERGETAHQACDHYRRWREDVELLRALGVDSYRFSIAWPRVQPSGRGRANESGLAHYDRLVDALCAAGIRPFVTLYHWDLPQALEDAGGWEARDTVARFADYAALVGARLGDRVTDWSLFNEPFIFTSRGYLFGRYAPGRRSLPAFLKAVHVVTMATAEGFRALKAARPLARVGSTFAFAPCEPATSSADDARATRYADSLFNHLFLHPLLAGTYPRAFLESVPAAALHAEPGDLEHVRTPLDFIGVNCYYRLVVSAQGNTQPDLPHLLFDLRSDTRSAGGRADFTDGTPAVMPIHGTIGRSHGARTAMGWEVWPRALYDVLTGLTRDYGPIPLEVCESGCAFPDDVDADGAIHDPARVAYHAAHVESVRRAIADGADVRSYHAWSLYDNFEWASGYRPRFGLIHVDYATQRRTWKSSAHWYHRVCHAARARRREGADR